MNKGNGKHISLMLCGLAFAIILASCAPMEGDIEAIKDRMGAGEPLAGSVSIIGDKLVNATLSAAVNTPGQSRPLSYKWYSGGTLTGTGSTYKVQDVKGTQNITVEVSRYGNSGTLASAAVAIPDIIGIYTADDIQSMDNGYWHPGPWGLNREYILVNDISITMTGAQAWRPIVFYEGSFNGNGKTITLNLEYTDANYDAQLHDTVGLFGWSGDLQVKNLKLKGMITINHSGELSAVGALAGDTYGHISNVYSSVSINVIKGGHEYATELNVGGLVGKFGGGTIENCYTALPYGGISVNNFTGDNVYIGGIAGQIDKSHAASATLRYCYSNANVFSQNSYYEDNSAGGIAGFLNGTGTALSYCVALNSTISNNSSPDAGRIAGKNSGGSLGNNYALDTMRINGTVVTGSLGDTDGLDFAITDTEASFGSWWYDASRWTLVWGGTDDEHPWKWDSTNNRPMLWFMTRFNN